MLNKMSNSLENKLLKLFNDWSSEKAVSVVSLPLSGSSRRYFRIFGINRTAIGVYNTDRKENEAFLSFTNQFLSHNLPVPLIYCQDLSNNIYLIQDLGYETLFTKLQKFKSQKERWHPQGVISYYKKIIDIMPQFQIVAAEKLDYSVCYPRSDFDKQSMMWDANYFKYYFLKLAKIPFDEQDLEDDFHLLIDYLLQTETSYFLYRDFQSRNIMIFQDELFFIDYQGGRRGALHYDLASLLYDAKADMPQNIRNELLNYYIHKIRDYVKIDDKVFRELFFGYAIMRIMQAMGAYGFRGFYEKKTHFLQSIPYAVRNLKWILQNIALPIEIPTLWDVLNRLTASEELKKIDIVKYRLQVRIISFSYKNGLPVDNTEHGGGYIFDCRAIHNPGRFERFRKLTGRDQEVREFFENETEISGFLESVYNLVDMSVENYLRRRFTNLMVSFGCTGGQHRSVYCAEQLLLHLSQKFDIDITLEHREQNIIKPLKA